MKFNTINIVTFLTLVLGLSFVACTNDNHDHEQENINTVRLVMRNVMSSSSATTTYSWTDPDGAGGNAPRIDTIRLDSNTSYTVDARFLDASTSTEKDYTVEIQAESSAHLVVWTVSNANITVSNTSKDVNGKEFGQTAVLNATRRSTGTLNLRLKHNPDKNATNPAITGETDVEVTFPVIVK